MSVITKIGDKGQTLLKGKMVDKDNLLLGAIGELDELQAVLGMVKLGQRQKEIYEIMGELAYGGRISNFKFLISNLEKEIKKLEKELGEVNKFLIFKNKKAVILNWVRTVCRRVERRLVALNNEQKIDPNILIYINRLSDYLFMLTRKAEQE